MTHGEFMEQFEDKTINANAKDVLLFTGMLLVGARNDCKITKENLEVISEFVDNLVDTIVNEPKAFEKIVSHARKMDEVAKIVAKQDNHDDIIEILKMIANLK